MYNSAVTLHDSNLAHITLYSFNNDSINDCIIEPRSDTCVKCIEANSFVFVFGSVEYQEF